MTDDMRKRWESKVDFWTAQIRKLMDLNAPDSVVGHAVASFYWSGVCYLGNHVLNHFNEHVIKFARQSIAVCSDCEAEIPVARSHPALCDSCNAKMTAELLQMEIDTDDYQEGESEDE